eukprot:scaffold41671_cov275-Isochrysis_galbana.AAC.1
MAAEKRAAFDLALQMAETPAEKTSLLQWAAAGGETAFRFTTLSAKTGADMFFNPVRMPCSSNDNLPVHTPRAGARRGHKRAHRRQTPR